MWQSYRLLLSLLLELQFKYSTLVASGNQVFWGVVFYLVFSFYFSVVQYSIESHHNIVQLPSRSSAALELYILIPHKKCYLVKRRERNKRKEIFT